ncbi:hypothetical protein CF319_g7110 [Tilletia indica]|nr:hypothetical protein CF319_g7110 [Tilletia indica]
MANAHTPQCPPRMLGDSTIGTVSPFSQVPPPSPDLPPEVLASIVTHILGHDAHELNTRSTIRHLHQLGSLSHRWRSAVLLYLGRRFMMIDVLESSQHAPFESHRIPWLPNAPLDPAVHSSYWAAILGSDWDEIKSLRFQLEWLRRIDMATLKNLSLDLRVARLATIGTERSWNAFQSPQWVLSSTILSRIAAVAHGLESFHVRVSPHADMLDLIQDIIFTNPHLRDIVVEVDSALDILPAPRPVLNVRKWFACQDTPTQLQRLIVRAPACDFMLWDATELFKRLESISEFRVAAFSLRVRGEPWQWVAQVARSAPSLEELEIAAVRGNVFNHNGYSVTRSQMRPSSLPNLTALTLDLPAVDVRVLSLLIAPKLENVAIRTRGRLDAFGTLPLLHFPSLSFVKISCSTPIVTRLATLGLPRDSYSHILNVVENEWQDFEGDFTARIRKDLRALFTPPGLHRDSLSPPSLWLHSSSSDTALVLVSPADRATSNLSVTSSGSDPCSLSSPTPRISTPHTRSAAASRDLEVESCGPSSDIASILLDDAATSSTVRSRLPPQPRSKRTRHQ